MMDNLRSKGFETAWLDRSCGKKYVVGGDMFPKEICCRRRYVSRGDAMLKNVSRQRRYLAKRGLTKGGIWPMEMPSSQRWYLAKGGI